MTLEKKKLGSCIPYQCWYSFIADISRSDTSNR